MRAIAYDENGEAEPGDAQLAYDELDADHLVDACRAVLAQVGEGDELAISCFCTRSLRWTRTTGRSRLC